MPFYIKYLKEHPFHTPNAAALRCLTLSQLEEVMAAVPPFAEMQQTCAALFAKTFWAELQPERTEPSRAE